MGTNELNSLRQCSGVSIYDLEQVFTFNTTLTKYIKQKMQETAHLFTFTKEILNGKLNVLCSAVKKIATSTFAFFFKRLFFIKITLKAEFEG